MKEYSKTSLLNDQPSEIDSLNFKAYISAIKELVTDSNISTPFTIGISGQWGSGKTTLMKMLEKELKNSGVITVWFNAWKYNKEDELWASFLQCILSKIKDNMGFLEKIIFNIRLFVCRLDSVKIFNFILEYFIRFLVTVTPLFVALPFFQKINIFHEIIASAGISFSFLLGILVILKPIHKEIQQKTTLKFDDLRQTSDYEKHVGFLEKFRDHFEDVISSITSVINKKPVVIFIDDLDRCTPDNILQIIESIKVFVDISGCIYVIGFDQDIIANAITTKYKDSFSQKEYLGKIIQLLFHLPPLYRDDLIQFINHLKLNFSDKRCIEIFGIGLSLSNLRDIKRTVNTFLFLLNLSQKRFLSKFINPVRLAKIVIIQHQFPDLFKLLRLNPSLLIELEKYFLAEALYNNQDNLSEKNINLENKELEGLVKLPKILLPFIQIDLLRNLLQFRSKKDGDDDIDFCNLNPDQINHYFTLTRRASTIYIDSYKSENNINFNDTYTILKEISRGHMSAVYLGEDKKSKSKVAIKSFLFNSEDLIKIGSLSQINHPNIIKIYGYGTFNGYPAYSMEYLAGGDLTTLTNRKKIKPIKDIINIAIHIMDGLKYFHDCGFIHSDLKPTNILFDTNETPKISDLDSSIHHKNFAYHLDLEETRPILVSLRYLAPEFYFKKLDVSIKNDLYSFGIILYELITGQHPYSNSSEYNKYNTLEIFINSLHKIPKPPSLLNDETPKLLEELILKLIEKQPEKRYENSDEVKNILIEIFETLANQ